jgi:hypothetical protein
MVRAELPEECFDVVRVTALTVHVPHESDIVDVVEDVGHAVCSNPSVQYVLY